MAVEVPVTINELNPDWPDGLDPKSQGDDHIRNIKGALKRTFPNIAGVVNASHTDLNKVAVAGSTCVPGMIMIWGYSVATIPAGWKLCNGVGTISTGQAIPNLTDRFVPCAGAGYAVGQTGGSTTHSHAATTSVAGTALTTAQLPSHSHGVPIGSNDTTGTGWVQASPGNTGGNNTPAYYTQTQTSGSGGTHTHGATTTVTAADSRPPFYALCYIIKD